MDQLSLGADPRPRISITTKSTGRITHQIYVGDFSFDRRSVKPDGSAFFICKEKACGAMLKAKYKSKSASNGFEKPLILKVPTNSDHRLSNGEPHIPNPAVRLVRETRQAIQAAVQKDSSKTVRQVFEECFQSAMAAIAQKEDEKLLSDFKKLMPTKLQMERSMYRWKKGPGVPYTTTKKESRKRAAAKNMKYEEEEDIGYDDYSSDYTPGYIVKSEAKHDADNFEIKQEIDDGVDNDWDRLLDPENPFDVPQSSGPQCYQLILQNQSLVIWDSGDSNLKNVEVQLDSENKCKFSKFVMDQAKKWEKKSSPSNMFEVLLKLLLSALIRHAKRYPGVTRGKEETLVNGKQEFVDFNETQEFIDHLEFQNMDNSFKNVQSDDELPDADPIDCGDEGLGDNEQPVTAIGIDNPQQPAEVENIAANGATEAEFTMLVETKTKVKQEESKEQLKTAVTLEEQPIIPTSTDDCYLEMAPKSNLKKEDEPEKKLRCEECGKMYAFRSKLNRHIKSTHQKVKDYACNLCKKEFACLSHVKNHMRVHHDSAVVMEGDFSHLKKERDELSSRHCSECEIWFETSTDLVAHVVDNHPTRPDLFPFKIRRSGPLPWTRPEVWERPDWTCPMCTEEPIYKADGLSGLVSHCRVIHGDRLICWVCGLSFPSSEGAEVYKHMVSEHPLKAVQACKLCGVYNQTKKLYASHMKVHRMENLDGSSMYQCSKCAYSTHRPDNFASHRSMHKKMEENEGMTFVCDECGNVFKTKLSLKNHIRSQHKIDNQTFECKECHKTFLQRHNLLQHMLIHGDEKAYSCEFCPQSFATPSTLIKHRQRNHWSQMGILPKHTCDQCDKRFWQPGELREHVDRVHLGLKNFVCTECGNRFGSRKVLSKHLRRIHKLTGGAGGIKLDKLSVVTATAE